MKFRHFLTNFNLVIVLALLFCWPTKVEAGSSYNFSDLRSTFRSIPDSCKLAVYWYWMSDQISKEGVVKDLKAMKKVGINRAYIGNIGQGNPKVPFKKIPMLSEGWWEVLHTALKTATDLGIEIGIFNSPGWSQSGGPWVKREQSMRYLANASVLVEGPSDKFVELPVIEESQDVKVLAYPMQNSIQKDWTISKKEGEKLTLLMDSPVRNVKTFILKTNKKFKSSGKIYAVTSQGDKLLRTFEIDRSNATAKVGFDPFAPIVIALPQSETSQFKFELDAVGQGNITVSLTDKAYIERYPEKSLAKMFQYPLPMWGDYLWEEQPVEWKGIAPGEVLDLTSKLQADGTLRWNVPSGKWKIVRMAMKTTGVTNSPAVKEATGLEVDKMSKKHLAAHFDAFVGEILRRIPAEDRKSFKVVVMDSYETGGLNWTDDMEEKFEQTYGYNPTPFLPVLQGEVIGTPDQSNRFLWDLRRLIADRVSYDYVGGLRELCHEQGLTTWLENYGHWGFPGEFLQYGGQSDEIGGEFWSSGSLGNIENRAASSCAHIYGKNKVWAESFTSGGSPFARYPALLKQRGDRFFAEGINSTLLHLFIHQPCERLNPGVNAGFGAEFNRKNTWFSQMDVFGDYLKRCNFMLQQGKYVADVAYYIGEDAPKMTGITEPALPKGYSFDYINAEILLKHATVSGGKLKLDSGMEYRVLVLPKLDWMRPELLRKLSDFVQKGLVILGTKPTSSPSLTNYPYADQEVRQLANAMWGPNTAIPHTYGKGKIYPASYSLKSLFNEITVFPDMESNPKDPLLFIHRELDEGDIYFVSNQSNKEIRVKPIFRVKDKQPELWNPLTQEIRNLPEFKASEQGTQVPLKLAANESAFIVFQKEVQTTDLQQNYPDPIEKIAINSPWKVQFSSETPVFSKTLTMKDLKSWTLFDDVNIQHYSGTAMYSTTFTLKQLPKHSLYLDLGKVMVMAKIKINGKYVGGVWTSPYQLPISEFVKKGKNKLEIEVVNNWCNRLIGDQKLPKDQRTTWTLSNRLKADSPLQESGLIGPVQLLEYDYAKNIIE